MDVFCSSDQNSVLLRAPESAPRVLPLPCVVDSHAVVLVHLLLLEQRERPVVLDASGVERLHAVGALLLACTLRRRREIGAPAVIEALSFVVRRQIVNHPLAEFLGAERGSGSLRFRGGVAVPA